MLFFIIIILVLLFVVVVVVVVAVILFLFSLGISLHLPSVIEKSIIRLCGSFGLCPLEE
jgi:hypothetical protein